MKQMKKNLVYRCKRPQEAMETEIIILRPYQLQLLQKNTCKKSEKIIKKKKQKKIKCLKK